MPAPMCGRIGLRIGRRGGGDVTSPADWTTCWARARRLSPAAGGTLTLLGGGAKWAFVRTLIAIDTAGFWAGSRGGGRCRGASSLRGLLARRVWDAFYEIHADFRWPASTFGE